MDVAPDEQSLACMLGLNLHAAVPGAWDAAVSTPSCPDTVVSGAFTVMPPVIYVAEVLDRDGDVDHVDFGIFQR
jgi:hypothetical protein